MASGIVPVRSLLIREKVSRLVRFPNSLGMLPLILQLSAIIYLRELEKFPMACGRMPFKGLLLKYKFSKCLQFVREVRKLSSPEKGSLVKLFPFKFKIRRWLSLAKGLGNQATELTRKKL